jgi:hypothetical protein
MINPTGSIDAPGRLGADLIVAGAFGDPRLWEKMLVGRDPRPSGADELADFHGAMSGMHRDPRKTPGHERDVLHESMGRDQRLRTSSSSVERECNIEPVQLARR